MRLEYTQLCNIYTLTLAANSENEEDHVFLSWLPTHNLQCAHNYYDSRWGRPGSEVTLTYLVARQTD